MFSHDVDNNSWDGATLSASALDEANSAGFGAAVADIIASEEPYTCAHETGAFLDLQLKVQAKPGAYADGLRYFGRYKDAVYGDMPDEMVTQLADAFMSGYRAAYAEASKVVA